MQIIKNVVLILIFGTSTYIGILFSKKCLYRVNELKDIKLALNIFKTKIKLTYEPIPDVFLEISKKISNNISKIFYLASKKMKNTDASKAWREAIEETKTNLIKEDIEVIKGLENLLRKNKCRWTGKSNRIN